MSADQDWSGGGFGRYKGLPLREISQRFEQCTAQPNMRAVTAILRITREQLETRGGLGKQPYYGIFFAALGLMGLVAAAVVPVSIRMTALAGGGAMIFAGAAFGFGAWRTRKERALNLAQEREIRDRAGAALVKVLEAGFPLQPLTREQRETVQEIVKQHPRHASIAKLLEQSAKDNQLS